MMDTRNQTLSRLLITTEAGQFLSELYDLSPEIRLVSLPIACFVMRCDGWRVITAQALHDYCVPRMGVIASLDTIPRDGPFDPPAEYMVGMAWSLIDLYGLQMRSSVQDHDRC